MSADGSVDLVFGGDSRRFRLDIANLIALQEKLDLGPLQIQVGLEIGTWRIGYITETLRIGLIGGGTDPKTAQRLVDDNVRAGNILPHVPTARAILLSALIGNPDDPVGKKKGKRKKRTVSPAASQPQATTSPAP